MNARKHATSSPGCSPGNSANFPHILTPFGAIRCQCPQNAGLALSCQMYTRDKGWRLHTQLSCHLLLSHLCTKFTEDGRQSPAQTTDAAKTKLVSNNNSSTNTAKKLIVSATTSKKTQHLYKCLPAQPSPRVSYTHLASTSKGLLITPLMVGSSRSTATDYHQTHHPSSHVTAPADSGAGTVVTKCSIFKLCPFGNQPLPSTHQFGPSSG